VPDTGGWQTWTTLPGPLVSLTAGSHVIRVCFDAVGSGGGAGNYNWFRFDAAGVATGAFGDGAVALPGAVQTERYDR